MISLTDPTTTPLAGASLARTTPADTSLIQSQADFASILGRAKSAELTPEQRAREGAEQLVAVSLVQPILKQMRENTWAAAPFAPNQAERTFRGMMDSEFAQRLVKSGRWGLVDAVARRVLRQQSEPSAAEPRHPTG